MNQVLACGIFILVLDATLCLALWLGLMLLQCSSCGGPFALWAFGTVKWVILHTFTKIFTQGKPQAVLCRLVVLLCLLSPVFESGRMFVAPSSEPYRAASPDLSALLLGWMSSLLACVVWEIGLCSDGKMKNSELSARRLLMRMLKYFKPDRLYIISAFSFLILAVICDTYIPFYQGKVIDMLKGQVSKSSLCRAVGQLALVSLGSALFSGLRGGIFKCTLARLNRRLKHLLFHTLLKQEVHFFETNNPGSLSSRLHSDVDKMGRTVALNANALVRSSVKTVLMLTLMLYLSWELTLLTVIEMPILVIVQNKYINLSNELKKQIQDCHARNEGLALQTVKQIRTVRSFRGENDEMRRYEEALQQTYTLRRRSEVYSIVYGFVRKMVRLGIKLVMLLQARSLIAAGHLTTGALVSFFLYQKPMSACLTEIMYCYGDTMSTVKVISTVFSYLDRKPACKEEGALAPEKLKGGIVFQNVTFRYPSAPPDQPALKSVSIEIQAGKMTALVGPSGSGKTSCVSLLKRLYEPQEGQILLDGSPLHHYKHKYLQQKIALVSQSIELFSASLRYNIEYGLKDCTADQVREAAQKVNADDLITELKSEHDADECADKISSGQRHCIALIRALVRDPQVLILDETTGKVDAKVWHAVLQEVLSHGCTVLVVAHKLKTVENADHIIFLENGEVVEEGTHLELLSRRGHYHQLSQTFSHVK